MALTTPSCKNSVVTEMETRKFSTNGKENEACHEAGCMNDDNENPRGSWHPKSGFPKAKAKEASWVLECQDPVPGQQMGPDHQGL